MCCVRLVRVLRGLYGVVRITGNGTGQEPGPGLGLAKSITDNSVVKIGDFAVAEGSMSFKVEIDDVEVAKVATNVPRCLTNEFPPANPL